MFFQDGKRLYRSLEVGFEDLDISYFLSQKLENFQS